VDGISCIDQEHFVGYVDVFEEGATRPAVIFLHDLHGWLFVVFVVVDRFDHSPDQALNKIWIFPNRLPGGYRAVKLKRNIKLGHVDHHLEAKLFSPKLFCVGAHREGELSARYGRHAIRCAATPTPDAGRPPTVTAFTFLNKTHIPLTPNHKANSAAFPCICMAANPPLRSHGDLIAALPNT